MVKSIRGRHRRGVGGGDDGQQSIERALGYYKHSYDDDYVYNPNLNSHTNYTQLVRDYETTAISYANNATVIARGYYDAANAGDWDDVIVPLLAIAVALSFCLGCCMGRCGRGNKDDDDDDGVEELLSMSGRKSSRRSSRQKTRKTRSGTPRRRYNLEESYTETDNESCYDRYEYESDTDDSDGTGYYYEPPGSPSSLSDYRSAQRESSARRKALAATKRAAIAMKAKATAEAALAVAAAKSDGNNNNKEEKEKEEKKRNEDWSPTSKQAEVEAAAAANEKTKETKSAVSPSSSTTNMASNKTTKRQWGKLVVKKKADPLLEARSRSHNFVGYYVA